MSWVWGHAGEGGKKLLLYPLPYYVTYSQVRYRHVLEPLMLLLLCFAVSRIWVERRA